MPSNPATTEAQSTLNRTPSHHHHHLTTLETLNFPSITESGPQTDEYVTSTARGYIEATEEDEDNHANPHDHNLPQSSAASTLVPGHEAEKDAEKGVKDIKLVTWLLNDPEDPRNWSKRMKWIRTMTVNFACFAVALGSSITVMDMEDVAADLNCSLDVIHLTITLFVVGFAIGPLAFSPCSELYGRRWILFISMGAYFAFTFPSAFAQNAATIVVGRMLAGISASAPMTVIGGSITDMWDTPDRGLPMALFSGTLFMGPTLGPVIAGYLSSVGWRWNYYLLLMVVGISWVLIALLLPETYAPVLLRQRAEKLRKETGDMSYMTEQERFKKPVSEIVVAGLIRPLEMLVMEPIILFLTLYLALIYALLYLFFFAFPIIFGEIHGFSRGQVGLSFLSILIGMFLCFLTVLPWQKGSYLRAMDAAKLEGKYVEPEARLPSMMIGSILLPIGLYIFAWTSYAHVHWIAPMFGGGIFGFAMICIYVGANSYLVDSFSRYAASAMAAKTLFSRLCGAAVPMFVDRMYHSRLGPNWSSCVLAITATIMLPIPYVFFYYGKQIRGMSNKAN